MSTENFLDVWAQIEVGQIGMEKKRVLGPRFHDKLKRRQTMKSP